MPRWMLWVLLVAFLTGLGLWHDQSITYALISAVVIVALAELIVAAVDWGVRKLNTSK